MSATPEPDPSDPDGPPARSPRRAAAGRPRGPARAHARGDGAGRRRKGYARVAVADVIERAGVSRKTFYEQFANKDECFLAAYDASVDELLAKIDEALEALAPDWLAAHRAAVEAYLDTLAGGPAFAKALLIEVLGAGPEALSRRAAVEQRFAEQLEDVHRRARTGHPRDPRGPAAHVPRRGRRGQRTGHRACARARCADASRARRRDRRRPARAARRPSGGGGARLASRLTDSAIRSSAAASSSGREAQTE